jgi:hypothetical protein
MNRIAASAKLFDILEYICDLYKLPLAVTWISYGQNGNTNSKGKRILCIDDSACYVNDWLRQTFMYEYARHRLEEGQGIAGKALQSNIHIQHDINAAFAIRLTSTHSCKDDYVLEFHLPRSMKEASELELLINKVLRTLQRKCLKLWKVWVRELNEASGSEVRLDIERMPSIPHEGLDIERMPSIPHEAVSRVFQLPSSDGVVEGNGFMTLNPTSNQAEETREPLEQVLFYTEFMSFFFILKNEIDSYVFCIEFFLKF